MPRCQPKLQAIPSPDPVFFSSWTDMHKTRWTCHGCGVTRVTWALTTMLDPEQLVHTVQCLVVDSNGTTPMQISPLLTIHDLKQRVQDHRSITQSDFYMTMGGKILHDEHLLAVYCIKDDTVIHIRLRGKGGMILVPEAF